MYNLTDTRVIVYLIGFLIAFFILRDILMNPINFLVLLVLLSILLYLSYSPTVIVFVRDSMHSAGDYVNSALQPSALQPNP